MARVLSFDDPSWREVPGKWYIAHLAHKWLDFRAPEFEVRV